MNIRECQEQGVAVRPSARPTVLDEILGNATDIPLTEHATDTHDVTLVNFGLFDLLGLQLSPRIRDLAGPRHPLLTRRKVPEALADAAVAVWRNRHDRPPDHQVVTVFDC